MSASFRSFKKNTNYPQQVHRSRNKSEKYGIGAVNIDYK